MCAGTGGGVKGVFFDFCPIVPNSRLKYQAFQQGFQLVDEQFCGHLHGNHPARWASPSEPLILPRFGPYWRHGQSSENR